MIPYIFFQSNKEYPANSTVVEIQTDVQSFDFNLTISKRLNLFSKGYQSTLQFFEALKAVHPEESKDPEDPPKEESKDPEDPPKDPEDPPKDHIIDMAEISQELV